MDEMELRQLEYFMEVCKELHFTRAAENLNIAQPTLSQQIKSLEDKVGIPLFDRIGKRIALTEAGRILLNHSQRVFYEIDQAQAALRDLNGLQIGNLTVGSLYSCVNYLLTPAILKFKQLYPNVELSILGLRNEEIINSLHENKLDLGITFLPIEDKEMKAIPLFTEELSLAVPLDHPLAKEQEVDMRVLGDVPVISLPESYFLRKMIDAYCTEIGITLKPIIELSTLESLVQMVAEGVGITILPEPYLDFLSNSRVVKVSLQNPTPYRKIGFIYK